MIVCTQNKNSTMNLIKCLTTVCLSSAMLCMGAWDTDFDKGLATANEDNRAVLVEFTGSDWCAACKILHDTVLPTKEFTDFAKKRKLVLVELDYPNDKSNITPQQLARREEIRQLYDISAYPTVLVVDGKGRPYGSVVGVSNTEDFLKKLEEPLKLKRTFERKVAAARKLSGLDRANALVAALDLLPKKCQGYFTDVVDEIIESDTDDTLGYKKTRDDRNRLDTQLAMIKDTISSKTQHMSVSDSWPVGRAAALELLQRDDLLPFVRLSLYAYVSQTYVLEHQYTKALEYMDAAIAAAPESQEAQDMKTRGRPMLLEMISAVEKAAKDAPTQQK